MIECMTTYGLIDLTRLTARDVEAPVIADSLSKINRFNGRTPQPWSVAVHSVIVSRLVNPRAAAWGLLHDAHEVFLGDLTTPAQDYLEAFGDIGNLRDAKGHLDIQITRHWQPDTLAPVMNEVKRIDRITCAAEMFVFFGGDVAIRPEDHDDLDRAITLIRDLDTGHDWRFARQLWLNEANDLASIGQLALPNHTKT
ncbi:hypothetical protein [Paracoccus sp. (in: a-proteobacteria)]|uniref:hypothetical protein n=1 Tax=Paracoccus sp. TaxID=267 RepID=UPI0026E10F52|nr:hypothetical protein [Paracoccus sp. (in: a-proteobacteria)]MDO5648724.1 hypothetical protein [Paracoccus sp. (in: a-proteobacteria)]